MALPMPEFPPLTGDSRADVCVVGAGIAGLSAAYLLAKRGRRVMVIDEGPIGGGATGRTAAHLVSAIRDRSHAAAIDAIEAIVRHERIDCDFARVDGHLCMPPGDDPGRCLRFPRQGRIHPLKYLSGLAHAIVRDGGAIHCGMHAQQVEGGDTPGVRTRGGYRIACDEVVVPTDSRQAHCTTCMIALRVPRGAVADVLLWDTLDPRHYARLDKAGGELLIVGGGGGFADLEQWARKRFPMARDVVNHWAGEAMETAGLTHDTIAGFASAERVEESSAALRARNSRTSRYKLAG
jgi:glycine/D-amino acid oxidase-like deaminating enzyme